MKLVEIGKESSAGHGPRIAPPASTQQGRKSSAGIVGCACADEVDGRRSRAAADSRAPQQIIELNLSRRANAVCRGPGIRLLPDLARRMLQAAVGSLVLRQIQQRAQRVSHSPILRNRHSSLLQCKSIENISKQKETL